MNSSKFWLVSLLQWHRISNHLLAMHRNSHSNRLQEPHSMNHCNHFLTSHINRISNHAESAMSKYDIMVPNLHFVSYALFQFRSCFKATRQSDADFSFKIFNFGWVIALVKTQLQGMNARGKTMSNRLNSPDPQNVNSLCLKEFLSNHFGGYVNRLGIRGVCEIFGYVEIPTRRDGVISWMKDVTTQNG